MRSRSARRAVLTPVRSRQGTSHWIDPPRGFLTTYGAREVSNRSARTVPSPVGTNRSVSGGGIVEFRLDLVIPGGSLLGDWLHVAALLIDPNNPQDGLAPSSVCVTGNAAGSSVPHRKL